MPSSDIDRHHTAGDTSTTLEDEKDFEKMALLNLAHGETPATSGETSSTSGGNSPEPADTSEPFSGYRETPPPPGDPPTNGGPIQFSSMPSKKVVTPNSGRSFRSQLLLLTPFFLLHASAGLLGGFTTIQLQHFITLEEENNATSAGHHQNTAFDSLLGKGF